MSYIVMEYDQMLQLDIKIAHTGINQLSKKPSNSMDKLKKQ